MSWLGMRTGGGGLETPARLGGTHKDVMNGLLEYVIEGYGGDEMRLWNMVESMEGLSVHRLHHSAFESGKLLEWDLVV